jgi:hypothetical protein
MNLKVIKSVGNAASVVERQYPTLIAEIESAVWMAGPGSSRTEIAKYLSRFQWTLVARDKWTFAKGPLEIDLCDEFHAASDCTVENRPKSAKVHVILALTPCENAQPFFAQLEKTHVGKPVLLLTPCQNQTITRTVSPPRTGSPVNPSKRIYANVFVEGTVAQAAVGDNAILIAEIEREIRNANKMMEIKGIDGQVIWKPYVDLNDLSSQVIAFSKPDTVYSAAIAHGVMRDLNDPNTWTGEVSINHRQVSFSVWRNTFECAVKTVSPSISARLINCSHLGFEYSDQLRKDLRLYFDRDATI